MIEGSIEIKVKSENLQKFYEVVGTVRRALKSKAEDVLAIDSQYQDTLG